MKAFLSNILSNKPAQPAQASQPQWPAAAGSVPAAGGAAAASPSGASASVSPLVPAAASAAGQSSTATSASPAASASPATASASATPGSATPGATTGPAAPVITAVDRKNAHAVLDAYVGVVQTVFDHQQPVRAEVDYFLRKMEDGWIGRDAHQELPKTQFAARSINMELPILREKGTLTLQEINAQLRSSIVAGQDFLSQAALKDESRRAHSVASLTRLRALQASLEQANQEAKRAQHQTYVAEFQRMHERYGRNSDGTRKAVAAASAPAPTATAAAASDAASSGPTGAESSSATAAAAPTSSANEQPEAAPVASGAPELSSSSSSSSSSGETKVAATVKEDATAATPAAMAEAGSA